MYLIMSQGEDIFSVPESDFTFADKPYIFFAPLPVCVLTAVFFFFFRKSRFEGFSMKSVLDLRKSKSEIASIIISLIIGSIWLSITMFFENRDDFFQAFKITIYTLFGFMMYLVSNFVIILAKVIISSFAGETDSQN